VSRFFSFRPSHSKKVLIIIISRFKPSTWYRATRLDKEKGIKKHEMPRSKPHNHHTRAGWLGHFERQYSESETVTDVEEVWFAGCHCGVCNSLTLYLDVILMSVCVQMSVVVQCPTGLVTVLHEFPFVG
jgi:hypothetical protein